MMNAIAIVMLSTIGLVMVLSPKPILVMSSSDSDSMLKSTKEVVEETLSKVEDTFVETKDALAKGVEVVTKPVEKSMGWFRRKPKPDDHLANAKEKVNLAKDAMQEASIELKDATLEKLNSATHSMMNKATSIYHKVGDKTTQAVDATKDIAATSKYKMENDIQKIEQKVEDVAKDVYNSAAEILASTKEKASTDFVEFSKDKVNEGAENIHDNIVDSQQSGLDKTKSIAADVKEIVEHVTQNTKEIGHGILEGVKDAYCKTIECLQVQAQEEKSHLSNLDQRVDHGHTERRSDPSLKETTTHVGEYVGEVGEVVKARARDGTHSTTNFARRSYNNMKNQADHVYHEGKDHMGEIYDSGMDAIQDYYDEIGQRYRSTKDYYDGSTNHHKNRSGRRYYKGTNDVPSQSYYDAIKDEANDYYNNMKDKTSHTFNGAYHRTKNAHENAREKMDGYTPNRHEEGSGEYISMARQRVANAYRKRDRAEDYSRDAKLKHGKDLGVVVESMGWRRVGVVPPDHVPISSDDEVVIGNIKYEWNNKGENPSDETISNSVSNSIKDGTHAIGEGVDLSKEHVTRSAQNVRDIGIRAKDQVRDDLQAPSQDDRSQRDEHPWTNDESDYQEYEDDNNSKNDDYISRRTIRNFKGKMRNRGHLYRPQRSKRKEYANLVEKDFLGFARHDEDKKKLEEGLVLRSWKDIFFKRPEGFLLLFTRALHLFTFSTVYGSSFWVTFVSGLILSKHIPRQQFGYVQSRIFPVYLRVLIVGQSVLFILHSILHPWFIADGVERWELSNFGLMIASTLINAYVLEPQATKVMFERLKIEKEEGRGLENVTSPMDAKLLMEEHKKKVASINQQFKTLHNYSSALNLISLGGLTCHLWHLAHRLVI